MRVLGLFLLTLAASAQSYIRDAVLERYDVTYYSECEGQSHQEPVTDAARAPGPVTYSRSCGTGSISATFTVTMPPLLRINGNDGFGFFFQDPITTTQALSASFNYPNGTALIESRVLTFDSTDWTRTPKGTCVQFFTKSQAFTGSVTLDSSQTCQRRSYQEEQTAENGIPKLLMQSTGIARVSGTGAQQPLIVFVVKAVYRIERPSLDDLLISQIHLVQSIQTPKGEVTLIGGKRTMARIFIRTMSQPARAIPGVTAVLSCTGRDGIRVSTRPGVPITAQPIAAAPDPSAPPNLADPSVDIALPASCIEPFGSAVVEAEVVLPAGMQDQNAANNKDFRTYEFVEPPGSKPFRIGWVRIGHQPFGQAAPRYPTGAIAGADTFLRSTYPIPKSGVEYSPLPLEFKWTGPLVSNDDWSSLLSEFAAALLLTEFPAGQEFDQVVGWLPSLPEALLGGLAHAQWVDGNGIATLIQDAHQQFNRVTLAHEIGHNLGLRHTNVNDPLNGCPALAEDPDTGWKPATPSIQTHGYQKAVIAPSGVYDFMSYCPPEFSWISPYSFETLYRNNLKPTGRLPVPIPFSSEALPGPVKREATPQDLWLITGTARRDGRSGRLDSFLRATSTRGQSPGSPAGNHCLHFFGAGAELSSHCFSLGFRDAEGKIHEERSFTLLVPVVAGATRATLTAANVELAAIGGSAAIQLTMTAPQAGERWDGGARTVSWNSTAGATARYGVQYSPDGGVSWLTLTNSLNATQLTVDTSRLQGGANLRFRVLAGSGVTTAAAEVGPINLVQNPRLDLATGTFDLHNSVVGQGVDRELAITNSGTGPLRLTALVPNGPQFQLVSPKTPATIMSGDTVPLVLRLVPSASGPIIGSLRIDSNDATRPTITIPLTGRGIDAPIPDIGISPATLAFGSVTQGQGQTRTLTITNYGPAPLNVTQVQITGGGFALAAAAPAAFVLNADEQRDLNVRFVPAAPGSFSGTVTISTNDPLKPSVQVALNGSSVAGTNVTLPTIRAGGVVNAASFVAGLSRGALGTVFGTNLATGTQVVSTVPWPRVMSGAKVLVAGIEAPLYYVSPTQINFQIPFEVPLGTVSVVVARDGFESAPQNATITVDAPGVFTYARTATDVDPIVIHLNGQLVTPSNPAIAGEYLLAFVTGIGGIGLFPPTGNVTAVNPLPVALAATSITLGGAPVDALYTGLTPGFIGLGQINLKLPAALPAGQSLPLRITIGGTAAAAVNLAVR